MVTLLLELLGVALIALTAALFDPRMVPAVVGLYLMWTARSAS